MTAAPLKHTVEQLLADGYRQWRLSGLRLPTAQERGLSADCLSGRYEGPYAPELAAACQCFYYFRLLHGMVRQSPVWATLLGDYFFSLFSKYLLPLDSTALIDAFSAYLKADTQTPGDDVQFRAFVRTLPGVLR